MLIRSAGRDESRGVRTVVVVLVAGLAFAVAYGLVWGVAWFTFMRAAWYGALAVSDRHMPWTAIWSTWAVLNVPLGMAIAAYFRRERRASSTNALVPAVMVLWLPMTFGMTVWAWFESLSLTLIAVDSAVNLAGLAFASHITRAVVRGWWSSSQAQTAG